MIEKGWFEKSFRRTETSMHIGWRDDYFSEYDPAKYVEMLQLGHVDTTCFFAGTIGGDSLWPTRVGHFHPSLNGRDIVGETLTACHAAGINVILYYSVVWHNWAFEQHEDWRIVDSNGTPSRLFFSSRAGQVCPNSPYRDFVVAQLEELCTGYTFEGLWADMDFWPVVCYCRHCQERFAAEVGGELPRKIDWRDARWVQFMRRREAWLAEFAGLINTTVHGFDPGIALTHNGAAFAEGHIARRGASVALAAQNDYMNHDFYGNRAEQSFYCKLFASLGNSPHFEYITPRVNHASDLIIREPTTTKSVDLMRAQALTAMAHGGAIRFYDDIDPKGVFDRDFYQRMGLVFGEIEAYQPHIVGTPCRDVAVYVNFESFIGLEDCGKPGAELDFDHKVEQQSDWQRLPACGFTAAWALKEAHIPFDVISDKNLGELGNYQVIVLSNVIMFDDDEVAAFSEFVKNGGGLFASKWTSLLNKSGESSTDFKLKELFGVSFVGETEETMTFVTPVPEHPSVLPGYSPEWPMTIPASQLMVTPHSGAEVLATICLPYTDPADSGPEYSQVHSDLPGKPTEYPAIVRNRYGKGESIYCSGVLEGLHFAAQHTVFVSLVRSLARKPLSFTADAPGSVETLLYHDEPANRYLLCLVSFQAELPNLPVRDVTVRLLMNGKRFKSASVLATGEDVRATKDGDYVEIAVPTIETFCMISAEYQVP